MSVLGHQDSNDLSFITDEAALDHHVSLMNPKSTSQLRSLFCHTSSGLMELLESLLTYNPSLRPTTKDCLRSPIFDSIRVKYYEKASPIKCVLPIYEEGAFDYINNESSKYSLLDFKKMIFEEAKLFKKHVRMSFPKTNHRIGIINK